MPVPSTRVQSSNGSARRANNKWRNCGTAATTSPAEEKMHTMQHHSLPKSHEHSSTRGDRRGHYYGRLFSEGPTKSCPSCINQNEFVFLVVSSSLIHSAINSTEDPSEKSKANSAVFPAAPAVTSKCVMWCSGVLDRLSSLAHVGCTASDWLSTLHRSPVLNSLQDFWQHWVYVSRQVNPFSANSGECSIHLFRDGIAPVWEDPMNQSGGKFAFVLKHEKESELHRIWFSLAIAFFYDLLGAEICGLVMQMRRFGMQITVWNKSTTDDLGAISSRISSIVGKPYVNIAYVPHQQVVQSLTHQASASASSSPTSSPSLSPRSSSADSGSSDSERTLSSRSCSPDCFLSASGGNSSDSCCASGSELQSSPTDTCPRSDFSSNSSSPESPILPISLPVLNNTTASEEAVPNPALGVALQNPTPTAAESSSPLPSEDTTNPTSDVTDTQPGEERRDETNTQATQEGAPLELAQVTAQKQQQPSQTDRVSVARRSYCGAVTTFLLPSLLLTSAVASVVYMVSLL
ncbi:Eukaryotic initiation factor 4E [Pelomyxa schiedti]|nr:Eukaryotic initiation factor 4E [Pelomyxa schiedti]